MSVEEESKNKYAIITLNINNRPYLSITEKYMKLYAKKINADFHVIKNYSLHPILYKFNSQSRPNIHAYIQKMVSIYEYLEKYERLLYVDDTTFITKETKNLFEIVSENAIGGLYESSKNLNSFKFDKAFILKEKNVLIETYLNTGILVVSKVHQ